MKVFKITESKKTAILEIRESKFSMKIDFIYIPNDDYTVGQEIPMPEGHKVIDWKEVTLKDGSVGMLKTLGLS